MQELLNEQGFDEIKVGNEVEGEVVSIKDKVAYVDIHANTEAQIYLNYYTKDPNILTFKDTDLKVGSIIKAKITKVSKEGFRESTLILLSCLDKINDEIIDELKNKYENNEVINVKVNKEFEKGFEASYKGIKCFMPKQFALNDLKVNSNIDVMIVDINTDGKRPNIKISQRSVADLEYKKNRDQEIEKINEGDILTGEIIRIETYGAIIKFNYATGLMKAKEYSHKFVNLKECINVGDKIEVKVIKKENGKLELSHKELTLSPFKAYISEHNVSDKVKGKLTNKLEFGLLIELAEDVKAMLHKSEYSYNPNDNFNNCVKIGDEIEAVIIAIDEDKKKISLSRKPLLDNPWERVDAKVGDKCEVTVTEINDKGLVVTAFGVDGFVPLSEVSENKDDAKLKYQVGDKANAVVLQINPKRWQLKLSIVKFDKMKEKAEVEKILKEGSNVDESTLGDQFKDVLNK